MSQPTEALSREERIERAYRELVRPGDSEIGLNWTRQLAERIVDGNIKALKAQYAPVRSLLVDLADHLEVTATLGPHRTLSEDYRRERLALVQRVRSLQ